jgi:hypothetical protein
VDAKHDSRDGQHLHANARQVASRGGTNPDGQTLTLDQRPDVNSILATRVVSAHVDVIDAACALRYTLFDRDPGETVELCARTAPASDFAVIRDNLDPVSGQRIRVCRTARSSRGIRTRICWNRDARSVM